MDYLSIKREDYAWAAGIVDGEGAFGCYVNNKLWLRPQLGVEQASSDGMPEMIIRLQTIFPFGRVNGPYNNHGLRHKPRWQFTIGGFEGTQAALAMIWPWLGLVKRNQATNALTKYVRLKDGLSEY